MSDLFSAARDSNVAGSGDPSADFSIWELPPTYTQGNGEVKVWCFDQKALPRSVARRINVSEWPNDAAVKSLDTVLEKDVDSRFFLSPKACSSILRRADKRGKVLPEKLRAALKASVAAFSI